MLPPTFNFMLTDMKSNHIGIFLDNNSVIVQEETLQAKNEPIPLATRNDKSLWRKDKINCRKHNESTSRILPSVHASSTTSSLYVNWNCIKATVVGNHEIADRLAMHIFIKAPEVPINSDICFTGLAPCDGVHSFHCS